MRYYSVRLLFVAMLATQHTDIESLTNTLGAHPIHPLGLGKCSCRTSVGVRRRALALLLEHGVLGHESLSVCEVC
jgi:hypothetical protein